VLDTLAVILGSFRRERVRDVRPDGLQHQVRGLVHIEGFVQSDRVVVCRAANDNLSNDTPATRDL
jgi:hypothetical protein